MSLASGYRRLNLLIGSSISTFVVKIIMQKMPLSLQGTA
uniref:Uncharacterized protein n=1 Tax=uncultured bacterium A1Q1_fos_2067 TaxID=1256560 RepID=L7VY56_9BACT|nr:hypothetical protein [uncultured bacterium A1Q1_fos_2067]